MTKINSLLFLVLVSAATSLGGIAQEYSIGGTLVSSTDGAIISHGHVAASLVKPEGRLGRSALNALSVDTDDHGTFSLTLPEPGVWRLTASGKGFRMMKLDEHEDYFTGVVLSKIRPASEVIFRLVPNANIEGYVVDEAGEAVRTAQVTLLRETTESAGGLQSSWQTRGSTQTDDLGNYEFTDLGPGHYQVMVQARPWYASSALRGNGSVSAISSDSPLDVAYPLTWYPGVTDASAAGIVIIAGGESRQADLRLLPVPSIHLKVAPAGQTDVGRTNVVPRISLLVPGNGSSYQTIQPTVGIHGDVDVGGLAPGTYEVSLPGNDNTKSILQIGTGSPRILDLSMAIPMTELTVRFDAAQGIAAPPVRFIDTETGRVTLLDNRGSSSTYRGEGGRLMGASSTPREGRPTGGHTGRTRLSGDHTVELAPGRYEVKVDGLQGQYLVEVSAKGAETHGHFVTVHGGSPELTLHLAEGNGTLEGVGMLHGEGVAGAMVMLVPATLGDGESSAVIRRDQTNSDGSFLITDVVPGRYILIVIKDGWKLNLKDATTLRQYLLHGVPVELGPLGRQRETVEVELP